MTYKEAMTVARAFIVDNKLYRYQVACLDNPLRLVVAGTNKQGPHALSVRYVRCATS
jgi:hypothetical protein